MTHEPGPEDVWGDADRRQLATVVRHVSTRYVAIGTDVWPTLWPVAVPALAVIPLRDGLPARLWSVALAGATGALCYAATFLALAVKRDERRIYIAGASELARARRRVAAAA
jgi:hypothetical protein